MLTTSLEDPTFDIPHIAVANRIMQYAYSASCRALLPARPLALSCADSHLSFPSAVGAVIASFLMSMGNRPKAAQLKYLIVVRPPLPPRASSRSRGGTDAPRR